MNINYTDKINFYITTHGLTVQNCPTLFGKYSQAIIGEVQK